MLPSIKSILCNRYFYRYQLLPTATSRKEKVKDMFGKKKEKSVLGNLVSGMNLPEGTEMLVVLNESGATLKVPSMKQEYTIALEKIQSINFYNETEFEQVIKSSLVGGVVGASLFGLAGAIIGSRPKTKEKRTVTFFLVLQYDDKGIVIESKDGFSVGQAVDYFKKLKPNQPTQRIEL